MASGTINLSKSASSGGYIEAKIVWNATADTASNTSKNVTASIYVRKDNTDMTLTIPTSGTWTWVLTINGSKVSGSVSKDVLLDWVLVGTHTVSSIAHSSDGSKSIVISGSVTAPSGTGLAGHTSSGSGTAKLDTIARATQPTLSVTSVEMGGSILIGLAPASSSFTHALRYSIGNASGKISSNPWTIPLDLANQIPNDTEGTLTIYCDTYSNGTLIGTKPVTLTVMVPESIKPDLDLRSCADMTGAYTALGTYVQNVSMLELYAITSGSYGSWITGLSITLDGKPYSSGDLVTGSGDLKLLVIATDTRGRSSTVEETISVAAYKEPKLSLDAHRCEANGTANDAGEYAKIVVSGSTEQINGRNTAKCMLTYGGITVDLGISTGSFNQELIVAAPSERTMSISATLSDALKSLPRSMVLSTGYATMDFLAGGKGIAFGTTATKEGFTCAMDTDFSGHRVTGLPTPVNASDAVSKEYVDSLIASIQTALNNLT